MKRVGRVFLTFCLFGGTIGMTLFFGLRFGLKLPEWIASAAGITSGLIIGLIGCQWKMARSFAAYLFARIYDIAWLHR